jgi:hypothetical protein
MTRARRCLIGAAAVALLGAAAAADIFRFQSYGGAMAKESTAPKYMVAFVSRETAGPIVQCAGVVWKQDWVVVPNHCGKKHNIKTLEVFVGTLKIGATASTLPKAKYTWKVGNRDLSVLYIPALPYTSSLPVPGSAPIGQDVSAFGFGADGGTGQCRNDGAVEIRLCEVELKTRELAECRGFAAGLEAPYGYGIRATGQLCVGKRTESPSPVGLANRDSGAPLTSGAKLIGLGVQQSEGKGFDVFEAFDEGSVKEINAQIEASEKVIASQAAARGLR